MAELEIDKEDVHDRSKWRRIVNVMKRKSNPIGKRTNKPIIYMLLFLIPISYEPKYCNIF